MQRTMNVLGQLDPIVENLLAGDFAGIQKWKNVRHIERAWVSRKHVEPKPDTNPPAAAA
jgi:hypothetical protein